MMFLRRLPSCFNPRVYATLMWGIGALTFFVQYACRIAPSGMVEPLMSDFQMNAAQMGNLAAFFYYPYVLMQVFVGRIVDRYPAHRVLMISMMVFLIGNQMFSEASGFSEAACARFLMGGAAAFTFVCTMKLALVWFNRQYFGVLAGLTQASGMLGVAFGDELVAALLIDDQWRAVIKILSVGVLLLWVIMLLVMRAHPNEQSMGTQSGGLIHGWRMVLKNPQSWLNALYAGLIFLPAAAFGEFWGIQYLSKTNSLIDKHQAASAIGMLFVGWSVGGALAGIVSDYLGRRKPILIASAILSCIMIIPVLYIHDLPAFWLNASLFIYGMCNTGLVASYAISAEINRPEVSGVSIAFCNMMSILLGTLALPVIGMLMDYYWVGGMSGNARIYTVEAYKYSVVILPVALVLSLCLSFCVRETYGKTQS